MSDTEKVERKITGVSVVIPALNEEGAVEAEIRQIRSVLEQAGIRHEIIVVDDGSTDATADRARSAGARVVQHPRNRGYGAAIKTGVRKSKYGTIVITDADGTYPATAMPELIEQADGFDMVVGARTQPENIPLVRRPAKWFLKWLASYLAGYRIVDLNSGLRVMDRKLIERFEPILPSGFSLTTTITLALLCNDYLVHYHPIGYNRRIGRSKIRPVHAYQFFLLILRTIVYFNPLKVFLPLGGVLFLAATAKFVYDVFREDLSESAVLGYLAAVIVWAIGLLSDQISRFGIARG